MVATNRMSREQQQQERAGYLFIIYKQMGPDRSITRLVEFGAAMGLRITETTMKRYSAKFEWQRRLLEAQSAEAERRERDVSKQVDEMNRQDAMMAQGMKGLVVGGIHFHRERMKREAEAKGIQYHSPVETLDMAFRDIANLGRAAQQIERLARGQATSRTEVWVDVASTVVREFVLIFMAVNKIEDADDREREYLRLGDEMMTRYYSETTRRQLDSGNNHGNNH